MTNEEAIRILDKKTCFDEMLKAETTADKFGERADEALKIAVEALEKQTPKKPKVKLRSYLNPNRDFSKDYYCPACDDFLGSKFASGLIVRGSQMYCNNCGQKIEWSEL